MDDYMGGLDHTVIDTLVNNLTQGVTAASSMGIVMPPMRGSDSSKTTKDKALKVKDVAKRMRISPAEVLELVKMGFLNEDPTYSKPGRGPTHITLESVDASLSETVLLSALGKYIYPADYRSELLAPGYILKEIGKFDQRFKNGLGLIEIDVICTKRDNPNKNFHSIGYAKPQLMLRLKEIGPDTLNRVRWGSELAVEAYRHKPCTEGFGLDEIAECFQLEPSLRNINRFLRYYENSSLILEDKGIIPGILRKYSFKGKKENEMRVFLETLYKEAYSNDPHYSHLRRLRIEGGISIERGIELRATNEETARFFVEETVSQEQLAADISGVYSTYFTKQLRKANLTELIRREAKIYTKEELDFLDPLKLGEFIKYHKSDAADFNEVMSNAGILDNFRRGVRMRVAFAEYKKKAVPKGTLTAKHAAKKLETTPEKVENLTFLLADAGFLNHFAAAEGISYEEANRFYFDFFGNKVKGFTDKKVRNIKVSKTSLDLFMSRKFPNEEYQPSAIDFFAAQKELNRQYSIDGKQGCILPAYLAPFKIEGKWFNRVKDNREIEKLMEENSVLRKRVRWGLQLKAFYEKQDSIPGCIRVAALQDVLGLSGSDWARLRPQVYTVNLGVVEIQRVEREKCNGKKFLTPEEFDAKYFDDEPKDYISKKVAHNYKDRFVDGSKVAKLLTDIDYSIDVLLEESRLVGIDPERLKTYNLNTEDKSGDFYFNQEISGLRKEMNSESLKKLRIALALRKVGINQEEAKVSASSYQTLGDVAKILNTSTQQLMRFSPNYLRVESMGIVPMIAELIRGYHIRDISEADILDFCKSDQRYSDIRIVGKVVNLQEFIGGMITVEEAKKEITGTSWLADSVFDYCVRQANPTYFTIDGQQKIHQADIDVMKETRDKGLSKVLRQTISEKRFGGASLPDKIPNPYDALRSMETATTLQQLDLLAQNVDNFLGQLYDRMGIEGLLGIRFSQDDSVERLMKQVCLHNVPFLGKYHYSDVEKLFLAVEQAAEQMSSTIQSVVHFAEQGYVTLNTNGISKEGVESLVKNSVSDNDLAKMSKTLTEIVPNKVMRFESNGTPLYPITEVRRVVEEEKVYDISKAGIEMLLMDCNWIKYLHKENRIDGGSKNGIREVGERIATYLIRDLSIREKEEGFDSRDFRRLLEYTQFLQRSNVHSLTRFRTLSENGRLYVDSENSYYTLPETWNITGCSPNELKAVVEEHKLKPLTHDRFQLYTLRTVAEIVRNRNGHKKTIMDIKDDLEVVMISALIYQNRLPGLKVQFNLDTGYIRGYDESEMKGLAHAVKTDYTLCERMIKRMFETFALYAAGASLSIQGPERDERRRMGARLIAHNAMLKL